MRHSKLLVLFGISVALVIFSSIITFLIFEDTAHTPAASEATPTPTLPSSTYASKFVTALEPIAAGSSFTFDSTDLRDCPACNVPPDILTDEVSLVGKIAKTDIVPGQFIVESMLVDINAVAESSDSAIGDLAQTQDRRVIIYTGQIWLVVKETRATVAAITDLAHELEGYVSVSNVYQDSSSVLRGNITIRVPAQRYQETLAELRTLAVRVEREESRSQDVTEEFIDLEARLVNLKAGEEAMQQLLNEEQQSSNIADIAEVQQKLAELRGQIEQIEGRLRYLNDQVLLATISIELIPETLPPAPTPIPTPLPGWVPQHVAQEASQSLIFSLQRTADSIIWGIIFMPLIIIYLIPAIILVWFIRRIWKRYRIQNR